MYLLRSGESGTQNAEQTTHLEHKRVFPFIKPTQSVAPLHTKEKLSGQKGTKDDPATCGRSAGLLTAADRNRKRIPLYGKW